MKTNTRRFIILHLLLVLINISGKAQEIKKIEFDTSSIVGKWIATVGEMSFELTVVKDTMLFPIDNSYFETLKGAITYKKGEVVVRTTRIDGASSFISLSIINPNQITVRLRDSERKIAGDGEMIIDPNNPGKAIWRIAKSEANMVRSGWGKVDFDIPTELEWTKVE